MVSFNGERRFAVPSAELWRRLSDARFLVQCIPGVEKVTKADAAEAVCTIRPGFAFARGTLDVTVRVAEAVSEQSVRLLVLSKGIGSSSEVEAVLAFEPQDGGTHVRWTAEVKQLGGLLKAVPRGLIRAAAEKVIADAWAAAEAKAVAGS